MQIRQLRLDSLTPSVDQLSPLAEIQPQLILVFASVGHFESGAFLAPLRAAVPGAQWLGCSTAGEICALGVSDGSIVLTAIHFDAPTFRIVTTSLCTMEESRAAGALLGGQLNTEHLNAVVVIGQGVGINGSALIEGLRDTLGEGPLISGGLAGDAGRFSRSYLLTNTGISSDQIAVLGLYGPSLQLCQSSFGGWQSFGPLRRITRSTGNVLHELDSQPALDLYRIYLGDHAHKLPGSGLLFPFAMVSADAREVGIIRTILGMDTATGSLVMAGEITEGDYLRLMHASTDMLVDGAEEAAARCRDQHPDPYGTSLALMVSCVGRKLVMGGRTEEEVEAVSQVLGALAVPAGFYSNGEIGPGVDTPRTQLHNQTMTIACICERPHRSA